MLFHYINSFLFSLSLPSFPSLPSLCKPKQLRSEVKRLNKENKRLQEERDFLNEAAAFFAASRRK